MNKKLAAIVSLLLIAVVVASLGCLGGGGSAKDMAKITPEGTSYLIHYDLQTLRDDKDIDGAYESIEKNWPEKLEKYGLDVDDTNYMSAGGGMSYIARAGGITILGGKFDLEDVRDELDDAEFDKDDYKGVELWTGEDEAVAISGDKVLYGDKDNVKDCIKVMKGDQQSVYDDDEDFREVIDKLPGGIMMLVTTRGFSSEFGGAVANGFVLMKEDDDTLKMKGVMKFDDEDDAEDAKSDLKRDLKEEWDDVDVELKGKFLEYTGKKDIDEWEGIW
jgi:hypothetical protein